MSDTSTHLSSATATQRTKKDKRANGEGSIYPIILPSGKRRWQVAVIGVDGKLKRTNHATKGKAEEMRITSVQNRLVGKTTFATNPKQKLSDFLQGWLDARKNIKPETRRNYQGAIDNRINPYIGHILASKITAGIVENLYNDLYLKYQAGSLDVTHAVLRAAFKDAVRLNLLPFNPMERAKKPSKRSNPTTNIDPEDVNKIYAEARKIPAVQARIDLGLFVGLRPGEVFGLTWSDLNFEQNILTIARQVQREKGKGLNFASVKTNDIRKVRLSETQVDILRTHFITQMKIFKLQGLSNPHDLMFPNSVGNLMDPKRDHKDWKRLLKNAGVTKNYTRYQMRKTAFTNLATHGVDVKTIMSISGHKQLSTLINSYVHATSDSVMAALEVQDKIRSEVPSEKIMERKRQLRKFVEEQGLTIYPAGSLIGKKGKKSA